MKRDHKKEIFTVLGVIGTTEVETDRGKFQRHTFIPDSLTYMRDRLNKISLKKKVSVTFSEHIPTRSETQLSYHWVLCTLISDHTGDSPNEIHEALMILKFGTKKVKIMGKEVYVRRSISQKAKMSLPMAMELINFDLEVCKFLDIRVPTKKELGYVEEDEKIDISQFHKGLEVPSGEVRL